MRTLPVAVIPLAALFAAGGPAAFAQDRIANGRVERVAASGRLADQVRALAGRTTGPFWIGYAEPVVDGERVMCCFSSGSVSGNIIVSSGTEGCCSGCRLEPGGEGPVATTGSSGPIQLEGSTELVVLARIEDGEVGRIRMFSPDCPLDAGGRTVYWLAGVAPEASVEWLSGFAATGGSLGNSAIGAIALHRSDAADRVLDGLVATGRPSKVREKAAFWLGTARGRHGFETLARLLGSDASDDFRRRAVFAISQSDQPETVDALVARAREDTSARVRAEALFWLAGKRDPRAGPAILQALATDPDGSVQKRAVMSLSRMPDDGGIPLLIEAARTGRTPVIRGEALFWLAQKAGRRAMEAITDAIARDPETAVKKRAVFALSQLPKDEGIPKLIEVARTNRNPEVRKQAMFWLGQSKDPRALAFFEEILKK